MRVSDELMWRWFELLSFEKSLADLARLKAEVASGARNPRDLKMELARELVVRFHGRDAGESAVAFWHETVRGGAVRAGGERLRERDAAARRFALLARDPVGRAVRQAQPAHDALVGKAFDGELCGLGQGVRRALHRS
jgi:tyrosyl-tRNA synthetase